MSNDPPQTGYVFELSKEGTLMIRPDGTTAFIPLEPPKDPPQTEAETLLEQRTELLAALKTVMSLAEEARIDWNTGRDMRIGKILSALACDGSGYRADIDSIHAAIRKAEGHA